MSLKIIFKLNLHINFHILCRNQLIIGYEIYLLSELFTIFNHSNNLQNILTYEANKKWKKIYVRPKKSRNFWEMCKSGY